jgi:hypothetical protein
MDENKKKTHENNADEENKLYCEKYKQWVKEQEGCKHKKEYCQFRTQCLIFLREKFKDL